MIALILHELRLVTRRAAWPVSLLLSSGAAALFVAVWGPENGVPLSRLITAASPARKAGGLNDRSGIPRG